MSEQNETPDIIFEGAEGPCPECGMRYDRVLSHIADAHPELREKYTRRAVHVEASRDIPDIIEEVKEVEKC